MFSFPRENQKDRDLFFFLKKKIHSRGKESAFVKSHFDLLIQVSWHICSQSDGYIYISSSSHSPANLMDISIFILISHSFSISFEYQLPNRNRAIDVAVDSGQFATNWFLVTLQESAARFSWQFDLVSISTVLSDVSRSLFPRSLSSLIQTVFQLLVFISWDILSFFQPPSKIIFERKNARNSACWSSPIALQESREVQLEWSAFGVICSRHSLQETFLSDFLTRISSSSSFLYACSWDYVGSFSL